MRFLALTAVPLAAFLTFMAQPLMGKYLLPWHGGSASTWATAMVFFQAALLAGYLFAHFLQRISIRSQALLIGILALLVPWITQVPPIQVGPAMSAWGVLLSLTVSLFPAILLTTCLGIIMHGWFRASGGAVPYYLYAFSNFGSLLALCSYPLLIEPKIGLARQGWGFESLLIILCGMALGLSLIVWRSANKRYLHASKGTTDDPEQPHEEAISSSRKLYWLALSAAACVAMIGTMRVLSSEIGSNPISWILPLAIYLLSFSLTFSGIWRAFLTPFFTAAFACALFAWLHFKGLELRGVSIELMGLLAFVLFLATHLAHGLIYLARPRLRFDVFYVVIATGGVLGGFFASISAPSFFTQPFEFPAALLLILAVSTWKALQASPLVEKIRWLRPVAVFAILLPNLVVLLLQIADQTTALSKHHHIRSIYGQFTLITVPGYLRAFSETTLHGVQRLDDGRRQSPTSYYHPGTGLGRVVSYLQKESDSLNVGVIGLGVGTLAAYGRERDRFIFWDIDPTSFVIAREFFSFVSNSPATIEFRHQDGRKGVEESPEIFDLLVVDAFTGDSIPPHLVTREAILSYLEAVPEGVLAIHISNRFMDLFPVLAAHANRLELDAGWVRAIPSGRIAEERAALPSKYFFFFAEPASLDRERFENLFDQPFDAFEYVTKFPEEAKQSKKYDWTDDRHAILDVLSRIW
jgi:hypothetical protein